MLLQIDAYSRDQDTYVKAYYTGMEPLPDRL